MGGWSVRVWGLAGVLQMFLMLLLCACCPLPGVMPGILSLT
jgi:hypothetical protein